MVKLALSCHFAFFKTKQPFWNWHQVLESDHYTFVLAQIIPWYVIEHQVTEYQSCINFMKLSIIKESLFFTQVFQVAYFMGNIRVGDILVNKSIKF